jgi:hypothetical protein
MDWDQVIAFRLTFAEWGMSEESWLGESFQASSRCCREVSFCDEMQEVDFRASSTVHGGDSAGQVHFSLFRVHPEQTGLTSSHFQ